MSEWLEIGIKAVKAAEQEIMRVYNSTVPYSLKPDKTPVTEADKNAEQIIRKVISEHFPKHHFYGEEFGQCDPNKGYVWVIDPIDGTKPFMRKMPDFATLLALLKDGEFVLGIANFLIYKELLSAEHGKGAFCKGRKIHVSSITRLSEACVSYTSITSFKQYEFMNQLFGLTEKSMFRPGFPGPHGEYFVAKGQAEVMLDPMIKLYDVAAWKVIIEEAGGKCYNMEGKPFSVSDQHFVCTNGLVDKEVLQVLRKE